MRDRIWLSFDLGPGADLNSLYAWLEQHQAEECGPGLVTLVFPFQENLVDELRQSLATTMRFKPAERVYLVYKDPGDGEITGCFIFGARADRPQQAPADPLTRLH